MPTREFSQFIYKTWFKGYWPPFAQAALSRSYKRLRVRSLLNSNCKLTPPPMGLLVAINVWRQYKDRYLEKFGLKGPPPETLAIVADVSQKIPF
jgi:hypothetical protein